MLSVLLLLGLRSMLRPWTAWWSGKAFDVPDARRLELGARVGVEESSTHSDAVPVPWCSVPWRRRIAAVEWSTRTRIEKKRERAVGKEKCIVEGSSLLGGRLQICLWIQNAKQICIGNKEALDSKGNS
jgi:hypothetical protein